MDPTTLQTQALITFVTPLLIQLAKRSQNAWLAWIDQNKPKVCRLTSAVAALTTTMGIKVVHVPHSLTVTWPDSSTLLRGFLGVLIPAVLQFAAQHALYQGFWRHVVSGKTDGGQPGVRRGKAAESPQPTVEG